MESLHIKLTMKQIEEMPKQTFETIIKKSIKESSLSYLNNKRISRNGKGIEMEYDQLEMQNYLSSLDIDITNEERKIIFNLRHRKMTMTGILLVFLAHRRRILVSAVPYPGCV